MTFSISPSPPPSAWFMANSTSTSTSCVPVYQIKHVKCQSKIWKQENCCLYWNNKIMYTILGIHDVHQCNIIYITYITKSYCVSIYIFIPMLCIMWTSLTKQLPILLTFISCIYLVAYIVKIPLWITTIHFILGCIFHVYKGTRGLTITYLSKA